MNVQFDAGNVQLPQYQPAPSYHYVMRQLATAAVAPQQATAPQGVTSHAAAHGPPGMVAHSQPANTQAVAALANHVQSAAAVPLPSQQVPTPAAVQSHLVTSQIPRHHQLAASQVGRLLKSSNFYVVLIVCDHV